MPRQIIVIDDEQSIHSLLMQLFERQGYKVLVADTSDKGIHLFKENPIDLVIVDLIMPEKDGIETIRELRSLDQDIKIIAISGGGIIKPDLYLKLARKFGAIYSFKKPIETDKILTFVDNLFGQSPA